MFAIKKDPHGYNILHYFTGIYAFLKFSITSFNTALQFMFKI